MKLHLSVVVCAAVALAATAPAGERAKEDAKKLEGTWKVVAVEMGGQKVPPDKVGAATITVQGNRITLMGKALIFKTDATKKPHALDLHITRGTESVEWPCIYSVKGNELRIAMPLAPKKGQKTAPPAGTFTRPSSFDTTGLPVMLITATREAAKE